MYRQLIAATLATGLLATPALAATDSFELGVQIDRSQFETTEGARQEYARIKEDVADHCENVNGNAAPIALFAVRSCEKHTLDAVVASIDETTLSAVHAEAK